MAVAVVKIKYFRKKNARYCEESLFFFGSSSIGGCGPINVLVGWGETEQFRYTFLALSQGSYSALVNTRSRSESANCCHRWIGEQASAISHLFDN